MMPTPASPWWCALPRRTPTRILLIVLAAMWLAPTLAAARCLVRPIEGTVGFAVAQQSNRTNAQAFGAVQLANEVLFLNEEVDTDGDGRIDYVAPFQGDFAMGIRLNTVYNVARVPTIYQNDCFFQTAADEPIRYGMHGVDVYATSVAYRWRVPQVPRLSVFYAGSITGSSMGLPDNQAGSWIDRSLRNRYNTTFAYGLAAIPLSFLAPLAPLINRNSEPTTMAGDFIAGVEYDLPTIGAARVGYAFSQGIFTNVSVDRLRLFAEGLLTQRFSQLALLKAGAQGVRTVRDAGRTSLYGRSLQLAAPRGLVDDGGPIGSRTTSLGLTTGHLEQVGIGGYVDLRFAYALAPTPFIHELRLGVHGPRYGEPGALEDDIMNAFRLHAGFVELPPLPWFGLEGGRTFSFDVRIGSPNIFIAVERNTPELLTIFPYAYNATSFQLMVAIDDSMVGGSR
jgi:hypothetical protein